MLFNADLSDHNADTSVRLDGLATPRSGAMGKINSSSKKTMQTPSISRLKLDPQSSPPDFKAPHTLSEQAQSLQ